MILVVGDDFERNGPHREEFAQQRWEPGGQRVGVHRDRQRHRAVVVRRGCEFPQGRGLEQAQRLHVAQQDLAGWRRRDGLLAQQKNSSERLLQRLDPLRHGTPGHVQQRGGPLEALLLGDGGKRLQLISIQHDATSCRTTRETATRSQPR